MRESMNSESVRLPTDASVQSLSDIAASKPVLTITQSVGKPF